MLACLVSLTSGVVILLELEVVKLDGNVDDDSFFNKPGLFNKFTIGPLVVLLLLILLLLGCDEDDDDEDDEEDEEDAEAVELVTGFDKLYVNEELDDGDEEEDDDEDDVGKEVEDDSDV
jgi:hypothetical protein